MAIEYKNLPLNTTYNTDRNFVLTPLKSPLRITPPSDQSEFDTLKNSFKSNQQLSAPDQLGENIYSRPLSETYQQGKFSDQYPTLSSMPMRMGGGEFISTKGEPNKLLYSDRSKTDSFSDYITRGGLTSGSYEKEHIIPLWAGGADTESNKMIMSVDDHLTKTKVQAVPLTLYKQGKIGLPEARVMAINWKDYDPEGIQMDENGLVPEDILNRTLDNWKKEPQIGAWDWIKATILDPKGEKYKGKKYDIVRQVNNEPATIAKEFLQSAASGATFGWVPPSQATYENEEEQKNVNLARNIGSIVGGIGGFTLLGKALALPKLALMAAGSAEGILGNVAAKTGLKSLAKYVTSKSVNPVIASIRGNVAAGEIFPGTITAVPKQNLLLNNVLKQIPLFVTAGQISRQEYGDAQERTTRFLSDLAIGGFAGVAGSLIPRAGLKARTAEYSSMFFPSFAITYLEGGNINDALVSGSTMVGLHGLGKLSSKLEGKNTTGKDFMRVESNKAANKVSNDFMKGVGTEIKEPVSDSNFNKYKDKSFEVIDARVDKGILTPEQGKEFKSRTLVALKQLQYGDSFITGDWSTFKKGWSLNEKLGDKAWEDVRSLFNLGESNPTLAGGAKFTIPDKLNDALDVTVLSGQDTATLNIDNNRVLNNINTSISNLKNGQLVEGADKVINTPPIVGDFSVSGTDKNPVVNDNINKLSIPFNNKEPMVGWVVRGKAAMDPTGHDLELWVTTPSVGTVFAGNPSRIEQVRLRNEKFGDQPKFNLDNNNVSLYEAMDKYGVDSLPVNINHLTPSSKSSGRASIGFYINENMWKNGITISEKSIPLSADRRQELINFLDEVKGVKNKMVKAVESLDTSSIIKEDELKRYNVASWTDIVREQLEGGTPQSFMRTINDKVGAEIVSLKEAKEIFKNKTNFTYKDAYGILNTELNKNGEVSKNGRSIKFNNYGINILGDLNKLFNVDKEFTDFINSIKDKPLIISEVKKNKHIAAIENRMENIPPEVTEETKPITEQMERDKNFEEAQEAYQIKLENEGEMPEITKPIIEEKPLPGTEIERPQDPNTGTKYSLAAQNGVDIKWIMKTNPETNKVVHSGDVIINGERMTTADASKLITSKGELLEEPKAKKGKGVSSPVNREEVEQRKNIINENFSREINERIDDIKADNLNLFSSKVNRILEESLSTIREETKKAKIPFEASKIHGDIVNSLVSKIEREINNRFEIKQEMSSLGKTEEQATNSRTNALRNAIGRFKTKEMDLPVFISTPKGELDYIPEKTPYMKEGYEKRLPKSEEGKRVTPYYDKFKKDINIDKVDFNNPSDVLKYSQGKIFEALENNKWNKLNTWLADEILQPGTEANEIFLSNAEPMENEISYVYKGLGLEPPKTETKKIDTELTKEENSNIIEQEREKFGKKEGIDTTGITIEFPKENKTDVDKIFFSLSIPPEVIKANPQAMFYDAKRFFFNFKNTYDRLLENKQRVGQMKNWKKISTPTGFLDKLEKEVKDKVSKIKETSE